MMTDNRWLVEDALPQAMHISLVELVFKVKAVSRCGVWPTVAYVARSAGGGAQYGHMS
jgi:hypothetical protein